MQSLWDAPDDWSGCPLRGNELKIKNARQESFGKKSDFWNVIASDLRVLVFRNARPTRHYEKLRTTFAGLRNFGYCHAIDLA